MLNFLLSPWLALASLAVLLQQLCLAGSTYYLGKANEAIADPSASPLTYLWFFLGLTGVTHLLGPATELSQARWLKVSFKRYYGSIFKQLEHSKAFASLQNKQTTLTWITGEALASFQELTDSFDTVVSGSLSVLFNSIVFIALLGLRTTSALSAAIVLSAIALALTRPHILKLAQLLQMQRADWSQSVHWLWDATFFGNDRIKMLAHSQSHRKATLYFQSRIHYLGWEQLTKCTPILFGLLLISGNLRTFQTESSSAKLRMIVLIPQVTQMLQMLYEILGQASKFSLLQGRFNNLLNFPQTLEWAPLQPRLQPARLSLINRLTGNPYPGGVETFFSDLEAGRVPSGYWSLFGDNGSGKTAFLLLVKERLPNALLAGPGVQLYPARTGSSSSQEQQEQLEKVLTEPANPPLLLDEWDRSLDEGTKRKLLLKLLARSQTQLILETQAPRRDPLAPKSDGLKTLHSKVQLESRPTTPQDKCQQG